MLQSQIKYAQLYVMRKLTFILLVFLSIGAKADDFEQPESFAEYQTINPSVGQFRFWLQILDARYKPIYAEIHIETLDGKPIQTIPIESWLPNPSFDFIDLNDDGYTDLLFYDKEAGHCCGPSTGAEVFLYIPKLKKFNQSETLTGRGNITKAKAKGCVNVNYKSSSSGYTDEEWCFTMKTGRWKLIKSYSDEQSVAE